MFDEFVLEEIAVAGMRLRVRHGGSGPAVVLLHGHPRTHTTWYAVAPRLVAAGFAVVCPDLRGYGGSAKPPTDAEHTPYSKRAMAADVVGLMDLLGHRTFAVVGHDRGMRVAYRAALDHPERVDKLVVIDGIPGIEALERTDAKFAAAWWHWWFFAQTAKPAERVICADPDTWYEAWTANGPDRLGPENHADFLAAVRNPATVHAMLEDYRAGTGVDCDADAEDRAAGRRISCPTMMLWSTLDDMEDLYGDPLDIWRPWCPHITGYGIESSHHIAENAPEELSESLISFLRA